MRLDSTKTWPVEYIFNGTRTKYTIGGYDRDSASGESITEWLRYGRLPLTQARAIAGNWKGARRTGHDPAAKWEALLAQERATEAAIKIAKEAEAAWPTVSQAKRLWRFAETQTLARHVIPPPSVVASKTVQYSRSTSALRHLKGRRDVAATKATTLTLRIDPAVKEGLRAVAAQERRSLANMTEVMI